MAINSKFNKEYNLWVVFWKWIGQTNKQKGANNNIVIYERPRLKNIQNIDDKPID